MHPQALGSGAAAGGIAGIGGIALVMLSYLLRMARMSRRVRRLASVQRLDDARAGIRHQDADTAPTALSPEEQQRRERAHAYWQAEQPPDNTLSAEGFIGDDDGSVFDGGGDPIPGQPLSRGD